MKFKVGDRVKCMAQTSFNGHEGWVAEVPEGDDAELYLVEFEKKKRKSDVVPRGWYTERHLESTQDGLERILEKI